MQPTSRNSHISRPRSATTNAGMTAQYRQQIEEQRRQALKVIEDCDNLLHPDETTALPMSRSPSKRKRYAATPEPSTRLRAASTSHAMTVPMHTVQGRLSVNTAMPLARSMPAPYLPSGKANFFSENDLEDFSGADQGRQYDAGSQLISPASSYQGGQNSSYLTTPSSFQSQVEFFGSSFNCDEPRGSLMSRSSSISGTARDMYRTQSSASYAVSNVGSTSGLFSMDEEPCPDGALSDSASLGIETAYASTIFDSSTTGYTQQLLEHSSFGAQFAPTGFEMSRSNSAQTQSTDTSTRSRSVKTAERSQRHLEASRKTIAPRTQPASRCIGRTFAKDKQAITRIPHRQKEQKRILCSQCNSNPDGFHGAHELRRHMLRAHSEKRMVWVCETPADQGPEEDRPVKPLHICKACSSGKIYNAYYNAAAHIRRAHFYPRPSGQRSRGEQRETRAGKAGGDEPAISWLKERGWIRELEWTDDMLAFPASSIGEAPVLDENEFAIEMEQTFSGDIGFPASEYSQIGTGFSEMDILGHDEFMTDEMLEDLPLGLDVRVEAYEV